MADLTVKLNQTTEWTCAGTSDVLTCSDLSQALRGGVQCETEFDMSGATVTITLPSVITKTVTVASDDDNAALIGDGFSLASIAMTNIAAGTYTVRFSQ
jgi:hypothetical protein